MVQCCCIAKTTGKRCLKKATEQDENGINLCSIHYKKCEIFYKQCHNQKLKKKIYNSSSTKKEKNKLKMAKNIVKKFNNFLNSYDIIINKNDKTDENNKYQEELVNDMSSSNLKQLELYENYYN